ncbi:hypothetical protein JTE90_004772 [Oedothorax gibbosus]|uniref:maleylacetoacetate isomerase n=1 Tax=Oedothorax gibbosus TaxID=931172 RepID=A0AAV6VG46_9ARAC|nr:hypothetical protein JTE90_004772 [Oedothorax gibbosus]
MAQSKPVLYSYFRSSCARRVRIALVHKGIEFEYKAVNLYNGDHKMEDFLKLNPCGNVPVLKDKGNTIVSSPAILEYLEETVPNPPLLPEDPASRAKVREIVDGIVSGIQPHLNMRVMKYVGENYNSKPKSWAKHWVESGFGSIERILKESYGMYCVGDAVTLADACLVPQVFNAHMFKVDMAPFPIINEICSRLNELKAFKDTHPFIQPDCPEDLRIPK